MLNGEYFEKYIDYIVNEKNNRVLFLTPNILMEKINMIKAIYASLTGAQENRQLTVYVKYIKYNATREAFAASIDKINPYNEKGDFVEIVFVSRNHYYLENDETLNEFEDEVIKKNEGIEFKHLRDCEHLLTERGIKTVVLSNNGSTYILVSDAISFEKIFSIMPRYIPSVFKDRNLTDSETNMLEAVYYNDNNRAAKEWANIVKENGTYRDMISDQLKNFSAQAINKEVNEMRMEIIRIQDKITTWMQDLAMLETQRREKSLQIETLIRRKEEPQNTELTDFIIRCKNIDIEHINDYEIFFTVNTTIENYDPEAYRDLANNGFIFRNNHNYGNFDSIFNNTDNIKRLFDHIFNEDPMFKIQVFANYYIDTRTKEIRGIRKNEDHFNIKDNRVPNWHISNFACLGGYGPDMRAAMRNDNYMMAMELCMESAASLDVEETDQTAKPFIYSILSMRQPCLIDKEGNLYTAAQALAKIVLDEKEKQNEEI